jgi:ribose transport system ATP-binding protein
MTMDVAAVPGRRVGVSTFEIRDLKKSYAGVPVLKGVSLSVQGGEIHALLGANGAGKSTLIKCVAGVTSPDSGEIEISGRVYSSLTGRQSREAGVAVVYQELSVAQTLNVVDNVFLGDELTWGPFIRRRRQSEEARANLAELGLELNGRALLESLSTAEAQAIEIVKALRRKPGVLILDEPTASLTEAEAKRLGNQMRTLRGQGVPLLYVTHRLDEVFELADRVSILRGGRVVLSEAVKDCTTADLVDAIVGHSGSTRGRGGRARRPGVTPLLEVEDLVAPGIGPIDLQLHPGEVLGVYGLVGSGRTELLEGIYGARRLYGGKVRLGGRQVKLGRPTDAVSAGVALVPSDRKHKGIFGQLSAEDNMVLPVTRKLSRLGMRRRGQELRAFDSMAGELQLQPKSKSLEGRRFSGGNQQKLVVGRWLQPAVGCHVLLLDEPTQGVDVGARTELYRALRKFVGENRGAIVVSSEPEELLQIADRVLILSRGSVVAEVPHHEITESHLLELAHLGEKGRADA